MNDQLYAQKSWQQFTLATWLCFAFVFFSHIPRTAAMLNILTGLMAVVFGMLLIKRELSIPWRSSLVKLMLALIAVTVLGVAVSPYWEESLPYLRREILPLGLIVILLLGQKRQQNNPEALGRGLIWVVVAIYIVRTMLATLNWWQQGFQHDSYSIDREAAPFVDFYAIDSTLFMPIVLAVCLYWPLKMRTRFFLGAVMLLGLVLVGISAVRTALFSVILVTFVQLLPFMWKHKKISIGLLVAAFLTLGIGFKPQIERLAPRYIGIFNQQTYKSDGSVLGRYGLWRATYEMFQERPLLGYGLGWQKMSQVVHQDGFYERWANSPDEAMNDWANRHFRGGFGSANPHNLPLQILFETGMLGLLCYVWLLAQIVCAGIRCWKRRRQDVDANAYAHMVMAYMLAYGIVNITNGFWLNAGSTVVLLVSGYLFTKMPDGKVQV